MRTLFVGAIDFANRRHRRTAGTQLRSPEALRAIAGYRGATMGVKGAEAFMLIRERV